MKTQIDKTYKEAPRDTGAASQWYHTAVATTVIGGVFSLIVLELMLFSYFQRTVAEPKRSDKLEELKLQLRQQPSDRQLILWIQELNLQSVVDPNRAKELEVLKTEIHGKPDDENVLSRLRRLHLQIRRDRIRQLDLQIRQVRMRRWDFSQRGSYLLLGSGVGHRLDLHASHPRRECLHVVVATRVDVA